MLNSIKNLFTTVKEDRYFSLKIKLILFNCIFSLAPLVIVITITYFWIYQIVHEEFKNNLKWQMEEKKHILEFFISERISALKFIANSYPEDYFKDQQKFNKLFLKFKEEFGGIIDMGVINSNGIQSLYSGPYELKGKDYSQTDWFKEMLLRNKYITDVFLGYRKVPHFSIIIKKEFLSYENFILLRISINMDLLQKLISGIDITPDDDIFLINKNQILQTNSKFFGSALEPLKLNNFQININTGGFTINQINLNKDRGYIAYFPIKDTSWGLVAVIKSKPYEKIPLFFTRKVTIISLLCLMITFFVIANSINSVVKRLKKADHEREIAIANAEHADKLASIGRLAAGVAHEINNPLAIINEKAGLMKDLLQYGDLSQNKERFIQLIGSIQESVTRCRTITHRLLSFSKRIHSVREEFDINEAIKEVAGFIEKEIQSKNINLIYDFQDNIPKIQTDKGQLQQVLLNLINNAIDAVAHGGQIQIETKLLDSTHIQISVKDNGVGIPKDKLKHIFEPFYTTKKKGTGLGLYISYGIVKKLGGQMNVTSEEGKGTNFTITIPINPDLEEIQ